MGKYDELEAFLQERNEKIKGKFSKVLCADVKNPELLQIIKNIEFPMSDIRAGLTSLSCEAVGGKADDSMEFCLMLEMASVGIGIHDDIIDKSAHSHFRKTILAKHGLTKALLVGDLLIVKAWALAKQMIRQNLRPELVSRAIEVYERSCIGLCEAELLESSCGRDLTLNLQVREEILWKINCDLEACAKAGAILSGGNDKEVATLGSFGRRLGFLFALSGEIRDCLNVSGNLAQRLKNESVPFPIFYATKQSAIVRAKVMRALLKPEINALDAKELVECCFETESFTHMRDLAEKSKSSALSSICSLKPSPARSMLESLMNQSFENLAALCL